MTEFGNKTFSVYPGARGGEQYRDNWERIYGKKGTKEEEEADAMRRWEEAKKNGPCRDCLAEPDSDGHIHHGPGCTTSDP